MTGAQALRAAVERLTAARVEGAARDARLLLAHALGIGADRLTLALHDPLTPDAQARFDAAITARAARKPVSQIIGKRAFWGREFIVSEAVLDPRPETETLVYQSLGEDFSTLLDLGTGSGCILLTLLAERPQARGLGVDLSLEALSIARANAENLGLAGRADLRVSDWFAQIEGRFDLIVSNPPYIAADEIPGLSPEVRAHEPLMALTPGGDGLDAYRRICAKAPVHLVPGGWLMVEIGWKQGAAVSDLFRSAGLQNVTCVQDMGGHDRVVRGQWEHAAPKNR